MIIKQGTSIFEAVELAGEESGLTFSKQDVDYSEIDVEQFSPEEIGVPTARDEGDFEFFELTVQAGEGVVLGYGLRDTAATYGRPVEIELHTDDV